MYGCLIVCLYVESVYSARMQMEKQEQARGSHDEDIHDTPTMCIIQSLPCSKSDAYIYRTYLPPTSAKMRTAHLQMRKGLLKDEVVAYHLRIYIRTTYEFTSMYIYVRQWLLQTLQKWPP